MEDLLPKVKENLILDHAEDDNLIERLIKSSVSYAEGYQHLDVGYYETNVMPNSTEQAIIMLASHFYESRDGSTAGFFKDNINASDKVWETVNRLLQIDRVWKV